MTWNRWQEAVTCRSRQFRLESIFSIVVRSTLLLESFAIHFDYSYLIPLVWLLTPKLLCCLTYLILEMREEFWESIKKCLWTLVFHTPRIVHPGINLNTFSCPLHLLDIRKPGVQTWHKMQVVLILNSFQHWHSSTSLITPAAECGQRKLRSQTVL